MQRIRISAIVLSSLVGFATASDWPRVLPIGETRPWADPASSTAVLEIAPRGGAFAAPGQPVTVDVRLSGVPTVSRTFPTAGGPITADISTVAGLMVRVDVEGLPPGGVVDGVVLADAVAGSFAPKVTVHDDGVSLAALVDVWPGFVGFEGPILSFTVTSPGPADVSFAARFDTHGSPSVPSAVFEGFAADTGVLAFRPIEAMVAATPLVIGGGSAAASLQAAPFGAPQAFSLADPGARSR